MQEIKKYFNEGLDADSDPLMVSEGAFVNAENINFGVSETGKTMRLEWAVGNILADAFASLPAGTNETVGCVADESTNRIFFFNWNSNGFHGIYVIYTDNSGLYTILLDSQVTGGLGITRYNQLHSMFVVGNLLYWTNGTNDLYRINVIAGMNLNHPVFQPSILPYSTPIAQNVITVIRKPPVYPVNVSKIDSTTTAFTNSANLVAGESFLFSQRYIYRDGEPSTVGFRSALIPFNANNITNLDGVKIIMPLLERPGQDVQEIELIATYLNTGKSYVIKTWNKSVTSEAIEINLHNTGTVPLTYYFFNTQVLYAVDSLPMAKPFDAVPLTSATCAKADSRGFWGNNVIGYDTPTASSLTLAAKVANVTGTDAKWESFVLDYVNAWVLGTNVGHFPLYAYVLYVPTSTATVTAGYYRYMDSASPFGVTPATPATVVPATFATYAYMGVDRDAAALYLFAAYGGTSVTFILNTDTPQGDTIITNADFGYPYILKTDSGYAAGIVFYDGYLRQCGVVQNKSFSRITTADRTFAALPINYGIGWTLTNTNSLVEIPDWAKHYSIVVSPNKKTSFFVQGKSDDVDYVSKDATGEYVFGATAFAAGQFGLAVKLNNLNSNNNGYTYQEGDIIKIYLSAGAVHVLAVKATYADWVIVDLKDIGSTAGVTILFELYSPTPSASPENFYEVAQVFPITDAGLSTRAYSQLTGILPGDIFIIAKTLAGSYFVEAMSPNDKYWKLWFTNRGRVQIVDTIGRTTRRGNLAFTNVYIAGTRTNGLSTFDALNSTEMPEEMGAMQRLVQVSKVSEDGNLLLSIHTDETAAIYIGETRVNDSTGLLYIGKSDGVIGTINVLRGGQGTINPESVVVADGLAFWANLKDGMWVQYSNNGVDVISNLKMTKWAKRYSQKFIEIGSTAIINSGQRPFIIGGYNSYHGQVVWSVPAVETTAPYGTLTDISPTMEYPFDIYDTKAKTLVYNKDTNKWMGAQRYVADATATVGNTMFTFKGGKPYAHKATANTANFFGVQTKVRLMYVVSQMPQVVKGWRTLSVEGSRQPDYTYLRTELPYVQGSDLIATDYSNREGIFYAALLRDRSTPGYTTNYDVALMKGDTMRGMYLFVLMEWTPTTTERGYLRFVNHGFIDSKGHTV